MPPIATPRFAALVAILLVPLYFWAGQGDREVWTPDGPRYVLATREMQQRGNFVLPTVNGEPYAHKPPLLFWSIHLASCVTGRDVSDGYTARLPSMLAAGGTLVVVALIGARLFGAAAGLLAALILATMHLFSWEAHAVQMDTLMTFWTTLAILFLIRHRAEPRARWANLFFLACGLGTLAKGPSVLIACGAALLWPHADGDPGSRKQLFRPAHLLWFVVPVLAWLGSAAWFGGSEFLTELVGKHIVKRMVASWHHEQPRAYFLYTTPLEMLPWSLLLPAAIAFAARDWRHPERGRGIQLVCMWMLFMLAFFSLPRGKRGVYMLPAFPAAALLIAAMLETAAREAAEGVASRMRSLLAPGFGVMMLVPSAMLYLTTKPKFDGVPIEFGAMRICAAAALAVLVAGLFVRSVPAMARAAVLSMALLLLGLNASVLPQLDPHKSPKPLCQEAQALRRPAERFAFFGDLLEQFILTLGETMIAAEGAPEFVAKIAGQASVLTFLQAENLKVLTARPDVFVEVLRERRIGGKNMLLARVALRKTAARVLPAP